MVLTFILLAALLLVVYFTFDIKLGPSKKRLIELPPKWKTILREKVIFYQQLNAQQKLQFEADVLEFLSSVKVTGVACEVTLEDRILIASSGVIPLFGFPACTYKHLEEVILYPTTFNRQFQLDDPDELITGMVGTGIMEGKMILSKPALHAGFDINTDKENTAIHEFIHLFDKENGFIDGVPPGFEDKAYVLPWLQFVHRKIADIVADRSDIRDYATTNQMEFFAVAGEYFFERPDLLKEKHPELYNLLVKVFNQDTASFINDNYKAREIGRNDLCLCGSGEKYKLCCWTD